MKKTKMFFVSDKSKKIINAAIKECAQILKTEMETIEASTIRVSIDINQHMTAKICGVKYNITQFSENETIYDMDLQ